MVKLAAHSMNTRSSAPGRTWRTGGRSTWRQCCTGVKASWADRRSLSWGIASNPDSTMRAASGVLKNTWAMRMPASPAVPRRCRDPGPPAAGWPSRAGRILRRYRARRPAPAGRAAAPSGAAACRETHELLLMLERPGERNGEPHRQEGRQPGLPQGETGDPQRIGRGQDIEERRPRLSGLSSGTNAAAASPPPPQRPRMPRQPAMRGAGPDRQSARLLVKPPLCPRLAISRHGLRRHE